jgi:hypothetical protein
MKYNITLALVALTILFAPIFRPTAHALSCLPVDMYLADVVGKEEIVIFEATTVEVMGHTTATAEVLKVNTSYQGYVEEDIFAYHQKDATWGYLCNNGPKGIGTEGVYVAQRSDTGKYQVYQRLELTDPLVVTLKAQLVEAEIVGDVAEISHVDRMNQIITTVTELLTEIRLLLSEYAYWKIQSLK